MEYIELGPVPTGETCAQVGTDNYLARSMRECEVFRRMLERILPIPEGLPVKYVIRSHPHDFGAYREVSVRYCSGDLAASDFACNVELSVPGCWDPVARQELADLQSRDASHRVDTDGSNRVDCVPQLTAVAPPIRAAGVRCQELLTSTSP